LNRRQRRKTDPVGSVVALCLLLEIALGLPDVTVCTYVQILVGYYFILLSILPASTTLTPVSFPGTVRYKVHRHPWYVRAREKLKRRRRSRLDELCPSWCCCRSSVAATEAFRLSLTSFARLIEYGVCPLRGAFEAEIGSLRERFSTNPTLYNE
jgi:hypothetical protein